MDFAIQQFTQPADMTLKQYADDLYAESCKMVGVYDKMTCKNVLMDRADCFFYHCLRQYWTVHPRTDVANIAVVQRGTGLTATCR